jgi:predicted O-methyltransferase YrrM
MNNIKKLIPVNIKNFLKKNSEIIFDYLLRPVNFAEKISVRPYYKKFFDESIDDINVNRRMFEYNRNLIPNSFLAETEKNINDLSETEKFTGLSTGYPAWNLLYYSLLCSIPQKHRPIIIETGTNIGLSTIIMAQVLKDLKDSENVEKAQQNAGKSGVSDYIEFNVNDSLIFLEEISARVDHIDFAFLDGSHEKEHVINEFEIIHRHICVCKGKVFFDNTMAGGVKQAIEIIRRRFGGNFIEFTNCSHVPPGNMIWQP